MVLAGLLGISLIVTLVGVVSIQSRKLSIADAKRKSLEAQAYELHQRVIRINEHINRIEHIQKQEQSDVQELADTTHSDLHIRANRLF